MIMYKWSINHEFKPVSRYGRCMLNEPPLLNAVSLSSLLDFISFQLIFNMKLFFFFSPLLLTLHTALNFMFCDLARCFVLFVGTSNINTAMSLLLFFLFPWDTKCRTIQAFIIRTNQMLVCTDVSIYAVDATITATTNV